MTRGDSLIANLATPGHLILPLSVIDTATELILALGSSPDNLEGFSLATGARAAIDPFRTQRYQGCEPGLRERVCYQLQEIHGRDLKLICNMVMGPIAVVPLTHPSQVEELVG